MKFVIYYINILLIEVPITYDIDEKKLKKIIMKKMLPFLEMHHG
jgi:hypothetical protein